MDEEVLQEIEVLAQRKYGRPFSVLSEEEKAAIYRDYQGERELLNAEYMGGEGLANTPTAEGRQAGNIYVAANPLEHLATAGQRIQGNMQKRDAKAGMADLSKDYQMGSRAAGDVAADGNSNMMKLMSQMMRQQQPQAQPAPAPPPQPMGGQPAQPSMPPMQSAGNAPPAMPPMQAAGNQPQMPGNPQEWMSYMLRASPNFGGQGQKSGKEKEEEMLRRIRGF